ncbi:chemotaxis protein CheA [Loktanella sp. R86503]|uniref:chemotaxis protein CheA n=1 Tax=Loktanella sp. R86503 TaxID=3093847 RepID=UPI0036DD5F85
MTTLDDIRQTFFQECDDFLEALDDGLETLRGCLDEEQAIDVEAINLVFRSVHSIKGGAAAFGLDDLVKFAHQFETTLDELRALRVTLDIDVLEVCFRAADQLVELVSACRDGSVVAVDSLAHIVSRLSSVKSAKADQKESFVCTDECSLAYAPVPLSFEPAPIDQRACFANSQYEVDFTPFPKLFENGHEPLYLLRELSVLGEVAVFVDSSLVSNIEGLDGYDCELSWKVIINTDQPESAIWDVFDFVTGLCHLSIVNLPLMSISPSAPEEISCCPRGAANGTIISETPVSLRSTPIGEGAGPVIDRAMKASPTPAKATVRVDLDHVDRLINVVGELVINQAVLTQSISAADIPMTTALSSSLDGFMALAREIQEGVMAIRAQSVKPLFQRMARITREAADIAGKNVKFITEGESTEVDKTVIESLVDPLTHIIRNAVDHGLESEAERVAAGKPDFGIVTLRAAHRSGRVLIDISDNGAGINRPRVLKIAMDRGLVPHDAILSDSEIDMLLFMPGFSTASVVTNLSGRGVGMDVVRASIQKLGGRINIISEPGIGTTMSISLPLTLAVLDGMVVDVGGQTMVIPITTIVETIRPGAKDLHRLTDGMNVLAVRGKFVPVIDLGQIFRFRATERGCNDLVYILVEGDHEKMWALAVDSIHDQRQVVIKGLESNYGHIAGVAAATILGDGKVALIVDPEEAVKCVDTIWQFPGCSNLMDV